LLTPVNLFRMLNELIFVLLGGLLMWLGLANRIFVDPRRPAWLVLAVVLIIWGARAWMKASLIAVRGLRTVARIRGASLALVGVLMISLVWLDFRWAGVALAAAGAILIVRGLAAGVLALRAT
jgi:hypothetical protein